MSPVADPPYGPRDDAAFLAEMVALTRRHLDGCLAYARMWDGWSGAENVAGLPYVHVGVFKHLDLRTAGAEHQRTLLSSSTSGRSSRVVLDAESSERQAHSSRLILADAVGREPRPLLVLDDPRALRRREITARTAAALALRPFATELHFVLDGDEQVRWDAVAEVLGRSDAALVYGFTSILWLAWGATELPAEVRTALADTRVHFVHSGGWKRLEALAVDQARFDGALLDATAPGSAVVDYYGMAEQVGVPYPLCDQGFRHVPRWAGVVVRDPWTLEPLPAGEEGLLQLMNTLPLGAPYHSVLTEDRGVLGEGDCECGRSGPRFRLAGRVPKAELRGCANV